MKARINMKKMALKKRDYEILALNTQKAIVEIKRMGDENVQMKGELDKLDRLFTKINQRLMSAYSRRYGLDNSIRLFRFKRDR